MTGNFISTSLGGSFHFDGDYTENKIDIRDIAHALSMQCRFTGHCNRFYSVAEHSVWVSMIAPLELALAGLMHDAAEAYIGDVAKPLKRLLPDYALIEQRVENAIAERFGLPWPMPEAIKKADRAMLKREVEVLFPAHVSVQLGLPGAPATVTPECWWPKRAKERFLERYRQLIKED